MVGDIVRIGLVDDHKIFRAGMELILNGFDNAKVVVSVENGSTLLKILKNTTVDLVFMDIKMPNEDGVSITKQVLKKHPEVLIIGLTMYSEIEYFNKMLEAGAKGFLLKNTKEDEIEKAVHAVCSGKYYFSDEFKNYIDINSLNENSKPTINIRLTDREHEILELIAHGYSNQEISEKLFLSVHTVDGHRRNLFAKTGVKNSANLIMYAVKQGLLKL